MAEDKRDPDGAESSFSQSARARVCRHFLLAKLSTGPGNNTTRLWTRHSDNPPDLPSWGWVRREDVMRSHLLSGQGGGRRGRAGLGLWSGVWCLRAATPLPPGLRAAGGRGWALESGRPRCKAQLSARSSATQGCDSAWPGLSSPLCQMGI